MAFKDGEYRTYEFYSKIKRRSKLFTALSYQHVIPYGDDFIGINGDKIYRVNFPFFSPGILNWKRMFTPMFKKDLRHNKERVLLTNTSPVTQIICYRYGSRLIVQQGKYINSINLRGNSENKVINLPEFSGESKIFYHTKTKRIVCHYNQQLRIYDATTGRLVFVKKGIKEIAMNKNMDNEVSDNIRLIEYSSSNSEEFDYIIAVDRFNRIYAYNINKI